MNEARPAVKLKLKQQRLFGPGDPGESEGSRSRQSFGTFRTTRSGCMWNRLD